MGLLCELRRELAGSELGCRKNALVFARLTPNATLTKTTRALFSEAEKQI